LTYRSALVLRNFTALPGPEEQKSAEIRFINIPKEVKQEDSTMKSTFRWLGVFTLAGQIGLWGQATGDTVRVKWDEAIATGRIVYRLSEPKEIAAVLGEPQARKEFKDGGMKIMEMSYPGLSIYLGKMADQEIPFTLLGAEADGKRIPIGEEKPIVLRSPDDLKKMDRFSGLANVDLTRLDLRNQSQSLQSLSFDSRTRWPVSDKLPTGFQPDLLLETGKNPGLGLGQLHRRGIDGRGIRLAIIDQPLLRDHREYRDGIFHYDNTGLEKMEPQMHASPVASIAVGRTIGVAPAASAAFFAVPMWEQDNRVYIDSLKKILAMNAGRPAAEWIRAVSISQGMFPEYPNFKEWQTVLAEAEAAGIFVVTCDISILRYGTLQRREGANPDDPHGYVRGYYSVDDARLYVPAGNRTIASHHGTAIYVYDRVGGMSWAAPYLAGLAALAFQVNPEIKPKRLRELFLETAVPTDVGPVVSPRAFIARVKKEK